MMELIANPIFFRRMRKFLARFRTANPPRHWYNYLWNEDRYCAQVSQMGHGRSYYLNEKADMCQINRDDARYVFVRDDDTGEVWNIGQGPVNTPVRGVQMHPRYRLFTAYLRIQRDLQRLAHLCTPAGLPRGVDPLFPQSGEQAQKSQCVLRCDLLHGGVLLSPLLRDVPLHEYLLRPSLGRGVL